MCCLLGECWRWDNHCGYSLVLSFHICSKVNIGREEDTRGEEGLWDRSESPQGRSVWNVLIFFLGTVLSTEIIRVNMHYLHLVFQSEQLFMVSCDWMGLHDWRGWWPGLFWRKHGCLQISSLHHSQASNSTCPRGSTSAFFTITSFAQQKGTSLEMQTSGFNFFKKFHVLLYLYYWCWAKYIILQFRIKNKIQMRS